MPVPLAAAAVPLGAKILGGATAILKGAIPFAKGITGLGMVAKPTASTLGAFAKGAKAKRYAGEALGALAGGMPKRVPEQLTLDLGNVGKAGLNMADDAGILDRVRRGVGSFEGFKKNLGQPLDRDTIATMVAPDLLFGGMAALTTEGDLVDKAIAGTGAAAGGIVGGLGARGILGPKSQLGIIGSEIAGGMAGDMVGYGVADNIIRMKHGGMTPAEQRFSNQDEEYRAQLLQELRQQYGL